MQQPWLGGGHTYQLFSLQELLEVLPGTLLRGDEKAMLQGPDLYFWGAELALSDWWRPPRRRVCLVVPETLAHLPAGWAAGGFPVIQVTDLQSARLRAAAWLRNRLSVPVIQVIGSAGKTTTKAMIAATLRQLHPVATRGSLNDAAGVADTILQAGQDSGAVVVEAGMTEPGHLRLSGSLLRPDVLVLTAIQSAHLVRLGSIAAIIAAKAEALEFVNPQGLLVINGEDANCASFPIADYPGRVMRYGFSSRFDVWADRIQEHDLQTSFVVHIGDSGFPCRLATFGKYNIGNALAAICVGLHLGLTPKSAAAGLANFRPVRRRLRIYRDGDGTTHIDDNFNANPESTALLLQALQPTARRRRLILVLGDVERPDQEIAAYARSVHLALGQQVAKLAPAQLIAVGTWASGYVAGAIATGYPAARAAHFAMPADARTHLRAVRRPGDVVVYKASVYVEVRRLLRLQRRRPVRQRRLRWVGRIRRR